MYEYLDRRYALAIYEVAEKKGKVDEYLKDLKSICDLIENDKDFQQVIRHPHVNTTKKKQLFTDIFKGNNDDLLSFMIVLIEKNRILQLRGKLDQMEKIDLERRNIIKGVVKTAIPLLPEELEKLKNFADEKYKNGGFGIISPKIQYEDGELQYLCKLLPTPMNLFARRFLFMFKETLKKIDYNYEYRFTDYNEVLEVPFLSGCFMFCNIPARNVWILYLFRKNDRDGSRIYKIIS